MGEGNVSMAGCTRETDAAPHVTWEEGAMGCASRVVVILVAAGVLAVILGGVAATGTAGAAPTTGQASAALTPNPMVGGVPSPAVIAKRLHDTLYPPLCVGYLEHDRGARGPCRAGRSGRPTTRLRMCRHCELMAWFKWPRIGVACQGGSSCPAASSATSGPMTACGWFVPVWGTGYLARAGGPGETRLRPAERGLASTGCAPAKRALAG
jgi:hypothetical protein